MLLECQNLSFGFSPQQTVLQDVSVALEAGQMTGLLGPNGSGKTTLLRLLSGVLKPRSGSVRLNGRALAEIPGRDRAKEIAFVAQENHLAFPMSVLEVVLLGRFPHRRGFALDGEAEIEKARAALIAVDLEGFEERLVTDLSGGEKQRVVLASALVQEPRVLLLDEPTAFLDLKHEFDICRLLHRLVRERSVTVLCIFHDLNVAANFCDRLIMLDKGRVAQAGLPAEVLRPDLVQAVFGVAGELQVSSTTGRPYFVPGM